MLADMSLQFAPIASWWLLAPIALAIPVVIAIGTGIMSRRNVAPKWAVGLGLLRVCAWVLFVLILLQPAVSSVRDVPRLPELLVLVDTSQSMAHPSGAGGSRLEEVRGVLRHSEFRTALEDRFRPHWFAFSTEAMRVDPAELAVLTSLGSGTHTRHCLEAAYALLRAEDRPPTRVLLVSDGNDNGQGDVAELARRLGLKVDVLVPTPKDTPQTPVIEIADVQAARRVLLGSETHFRVTLQADPPQAEETKLSLRLSEDDKELQTMPVAMKAGQTQQVLMLAHRPNATGTKTYHFQLLPAGGDAARGKDIVVQVVDCKYEILVLEDSWRWEYKFLHRLFEDDPSFRFTSISPRANSGYIQFASPDRGVNLVGFPQSGAELEGFDLFFLGDVDPKRWPRGVPEALARLVADEGKSLVVIAGTKLGNLAEAPALHALLPVDLNRDFGVPVSGTIEVQPRAEATASPFFFQLGKEFGALPPVDHVYPALRKRAGTTVLLEAAKHRNDYGPLIVLAEHAIGRGKVLFVGTDTLWKWHTLAVKDGPTPYSVFWQQALRALTPERSQIGPVQVWLTPSRTHTPAGQAMTIEAEIQSAKPLSASRIEAVITRPNGTRTPIALAGDPVQPMRFRTTITPTAAGLHHVHVVLRSDGKTVAEADNDFQVEPAHDESHDTGIDTANLRRIAALTGGNWIDPAKPETWPTAHTESLGTVAQIRTFDLWGSFTLLLLLLALLGTDWVLRVMKGFV